MKFAGPERFQQIKSINQLTFALGHSSVGCPLSSLDEVPFVSVSDKVLGFVTAVSFNL